MFEFPNDKGIHLHISYTWHMWTKYIKAQKHAEYVDSSASHEVIFTFDGEIVHPEIKHMLNHWHRDPGQIPPYICLCVNGSLNSNDIKVVAWLRCIAKNQDTCFCFMEIACEVCGDPNLTKWHEVLGDCASTMTSMPSTLMEGYKQAFSTAEVNSITPEDVIHSLHWNGATTS